MTTKTMLTDHELIMAFSNARPEGKKVFLATFTPEGKKGVEYWDEKYFTATNKPEAVRIAREYGARIINKNCNYVYLASKGA